MDTSPRDEQLWKVAKKRAGFKTSLTLYIVINIFLWLIWFFTNNERDDWNGIPWPVWVMAGWGLGIIMQYLDAYRGDKQTMAEREYKKLRDKREL